MQIRYVHLCWGFGLAVAAGWAVAARPDQIGPPNQVVNVPTFHNEGLGVVAFRAAELTGKSVPAWRESADLADKTGAIPPPESGYVLNSLVIVELADRNVVPEPLRRLATNAGATLATDPGVPGFVMIDSAAPKWNVAAAIDLALAARAVPGVKSAYLDMRTPVGPRTLPTDPLFLNQWHLHNLTDPLFDVNAEPAWDAGYTGMGVVIGIVDQGWSITHPDLAAAFHLEASQTGGTSDSHATSCAGVAGARANNGEGLVGIAYDAMMSKLYYGSAATNAAAFGFRNDLNHIKSNSWGPSDNAMISYMASNERTAMTTALTTGRDGRGVIFVWAAGNGGTRSDRVDYDPYASSRMTISVGAIDHTDQRSVYSEPGSALLTVAQSDRDLGTSSDVGIWTTIPPMGYTSSFGGTSSACPLGAGAIALILQARPELTWRDVKHILVRSARRCNPMHSGWVFNSAGRAVNYEYGFGAIDAGAATALAAHWRLVPPEMFVTSNTLSVAAAIPDNNPTGVTRSFVVGDDLVVEHVEVVLNVTHSFVGDLRIVLTSPGGTESILALPRNDPTDNYSGYVFTSVRSWDERSPGEWRLRISDELPGNTGTWMNWRLNIYGTTPPCPADVNGDGFINSQDFFDFMSDFFSGDGDFNRNGFTDSQDFFDFLTAFFGGC